MKYNIGDKLYYVHVENHCFSRKKIYMTDADGVEWYRYDKPLRTFVMKECQIIGQLVFLIQGKVDASSIPLDFCVVLDGDEEHEVYEEEIHESTEGLYVGISHWFSSLEEALKYMKLLQEEVDRLEKA